MHLVSIPRVRVIGTAFALVAVLAVQALAPAPASAGKLYQLNFEWKGPAPTLPATIEFRVHGNDDCDDLRGVSNETFNGNGDIPSYSSDGVAFLTDTRVINGQLCIEAQANGYDNGKFKSNSCFEIVVNGQVSSLPLHTSCSQPIPFETPTGDGNAWTIVGGAGECLPNPNPNCPNTDDVYQLSGCFDVDISGCSPTGVTFNFYKKEDELKGTSTADIAGGALSNIACDDFACLLSSSIDGNTLTVCFDSFGSKDDGTYESDSSWEIVVDGCGTYKTTKIHTSCSQVVLTDTPIDLGTMNGTITFDGETSCGGCLASTPISIEKQTWGEVKGLYRQ